MKTSEAHFLPTVLLGDGVDAFVLADEYATSVGSAWGRSTVTGPVGRFSAKSQGRR